MWGLPSQQKLSQRLHVGCQRTQRTQRTQRRDKTHFCCSCWTVKRPFKLLIAQIATLREQWGGRGVGGGGGTCKTSFYNPEKGRGTGLCGIALDFPQTDVSPGDVNSRVCGLKEQMSSVKNWENAHRQAPLTLQQILIVREATERSCDLRVSLWVSACSFQVSVSDVRCLCSYPVEKINTPGQASATGPLFTVARLQMEERGEHLSVNLFPLIHIQQTQSNLKL